MDINDIKSTVANLTLYDIKAGFRKAQNGTSDPNPPQTLNEIMPMIYRRFTEKAAEEWRQIYKALQLLEFLVKHGSERVIDDARGHLTLLKMLRQFQYIDQNGKDQGVNVRNRAKELAELLSDVDRIRTERKKARATKNKYTGVEGGTFGSGGSFSSGGGRYGGFGSESAGGPSASFGGYSGGVYGDGGGFGGQEPNDFRSGGSRSDRFEEYDEYDDGGGAGRARSSRRAGERPSRRAPAAASAAPAQPAKKKEKEPEVDLFSFDEPAQTSTPALAASGGGGGGSSGLADLAGGSSAPAAAGNDDDEFDDFQSAAPAAAPAVTSSAASTARFAAPQPQSAPQQANISQMVSMSSISPTPTPGANYSAFAAPAAGAPAAQPMGFQPTGPNYFGGGGMAAQSTGGTAASAAAGGLGSPLSATSAPSAKAAAGGSSSAAAGGGDAFGALWGKASAGIKKTSTPTNAPALGQLAKEKSSAGIWGAPASQPTGSAGPRPAPAAPQGGSASDDLLG
ncbi:epsin [Geosmithia morbida]|uniref:Epsin n=1 Tax=Geosmithia morbida TaxID=1094350 RepID=A0A9P4YYT1_9HYPO|nr:epsin [Geosmithia morbida]KAF4125007.1 epsin [Geosmithia morbida]